MKSTNWTSIWFASVLPRQPVISHPRTFHAQSIRTQIQTIRSQFMSVRTRTVDRFVSILTFSDAQNPEMSRNTLVQGREKTSIVAYNKLVESSE